MSYWQKVRVTFQDAGGNGVSAVMWRADGDGVLYTHRDNLTPALWIEWNDDYELARVELIRELPTGVGAVIRCIASFRMGNPSDDVYTLGVDGKWRSGHEAVTPDQMLHWEYEILSEGIQIGDVK